MGGVGTEPGAEQFDHTVVEREHAVPIGLVPPELHQLGELVGLRSARSWHSDESSLEAVELPRLVVEGRPRPGACTPPSTPPPPSARLPAISKYWTVLVGAAAASARIEAERVPGDRELLDASVDVGRRHADELEDRRRDVADVDELVTSPTAPRSAGARSATCTMSGTWTPPSWVFCLYHLNGVLPACAQPHG